MSKFLKNISFFILYCMGLFFVIIVLYVFITGVRWKDLPAPNLSNSYSLNDKMSFIKKKKADVITVGSSISLNNVSSGVITNSLKTDSYLNLSSWGLTTKDIFFIMKIYSSIYKPTTVIIASNYLDFQSQDKEFNYKEVSDYLKDTTDKINYLFLNFNLDYYFKNFTYHKFTKSSDNFYESLKYDKYGAVLLNPSNFIINKKRWNRVDFSDLREVSYDYLDSISNFCKQSKIKLMFFQSPIRSGIYKNLKKDGLLRHNNRVKQIILKNGEIFIDSNDRVWPDSLFVDALHLNSTGARQFTKYCFDKINK